MATVCAVFTALLCFVLSFTTYQFYTKTMYGRYEKQLTSIIDYIEAHIDHDDMAICADTFVESEKYREFQEFFDDFIDHYTDVHYLYLMKVADASDPIGVYEICAANSSYEKEFEPELVLHLGDGEEDWFEEDMKELFRGILASKEDVFFEDKSMWGTDYTLARPVANSKGEYYGLLCADISIDVIAHTIYRYINISIVLIAVSGLVFYLLLLRWMRRNVTLPIRTLENSVAAFAGDSTGKRNPDDLVFIPPDLHTQNEVASLSEAVSTLSYNMKDYVKSIVAAEKQTRNLQEHVTEISMIAYRDALTGVKNRAAFDETKAAFDGVIAEGNAEFGIVMADVNSLKDINDRYGHDKGNEYIVGACRILCRTFENSPVYRIGGDEFVAIITKRDYQNRVRLLSALKDEYMRSMTDNNRQPWERFSAASGMAVYKSGDSFDDVFVRADKAMYDAKAMMKDFIKV